MTSPPANGQLRVAKDTCTPAVADETTESVFFTKLAALAVKNVRKEAKDGTFPYGIEASPTILDTTQAQSVVQ
jgi:hypothetical protein